MVFRLIISFMKSLIQISEKTMKTSSRGGEKTGQEHGPTAHRQEIQMENL